MSNKFLRTLVILPLLAGSALTVHAAERGRNQYKGGAPAQTQSTTATTTATSQDVAPTPASQARGRQTMQPAPTGTAGRPPQPSAEIAALMQRGRVPIPQLPSVPPLSAVREQALDRSGPADLSASAREDVQPASPAARDDGGVPAFDIFDAVVDIMASPQADAETRATIERRILADLGTKFRHPITRENARAAINALFESVANRSLSLEARAAEEEDDEGRMPVGTPRVRAVRETSLDMPLSVTPQPEATRSQALSSEHIALLQQYMAQQRAAQSAGGIGRERTLGVGEARALEEDVASQGSDEGDRESVAPSEVETRTLTQSQVVPSSRGRTAVQPAAPLTQAVTVPERALPPAVTQPQTASVTRGRQALQPTPQSTASSSALVATTQLRAQPPASTAQPPAPTQPVTATRGRGQYNPANSTQ